MSASIVAFLLVRGLLSDFRALAVPARNCLAEERAPRLIELDLAFADLPGEIFLGRSVNRHKQVSDVTAHAIDEEVRMLIDNCYGEAKRILESNRDKLDVMAAALMKYETIDEAQIKDIMEGRDPRPPADWDEPSEPGKLAQREIAPDKGAAPLGGPAGQH